MRTVPTAAWLDARILPDYKTRQSMLGDLPSTLRPLFFGRVRWFYPAFADLRRCYHLPWRTTRRVFPRFYRFVQLCTFYPACSPHDVLPPPTDVFHTCTATTLPSLVRLLPPPVWLA